MMALLIVLAICCQILYTYLLIKIVRDRCSKKHMETFTKGEVHIEIQRTAPAVETFSAIAVSATERFCDEYAEYVRSLPFAKPVTKGTKFKTTLLYKWEIVK